MRRLGLFFFFLAISIVEGVGLVLVHAGAVMFPLILGSVFALVMLFLSRDVLLLEERYPNAPEPERAPRKPREHRWHLPHLGHSHG